MKRTPTANALQDIFVLGGLVVASTGVGFIHWPSALVAFGGGLFVLGMWASR